MGTLLLPISSHHQDYRTEQTHLAHAFSLGSVLLDPILVASIVIVLQCQKVFVGRCLDDLVNAVAYVSSSNNGLNRYRECQVPAEMDIGPTCVSRTA
jgi:hypothetical protein